MEPRICEGAGILEEIKILKPKKVWYFVFPCQEKILIKVFCQSITAFYNIYLSVVQKQFEFFISQFPCIFIYCCYK